METRVVVTGMGVVSAIGIGADNFWNSAVKGKNGISEITLFDTSEYQSRYGGQIKDFNPTDFIKPERIEEMGRASQLSVAAAKMAVKMAGLEGNVEMLSNACAILGTTMGEGQITEKIDLNIINNVEDKGLFKKLPAFQISNNICREVGINGDSMMIPNACAAGNFAIGYAYDLIKTGRRKFAVAGGADPLSEVAFKGFSKLRSMADDVCRPFDRNRKGMMIGEGAGVLFIESLESAKMRNATIYAEIIGYGASCDAYHMVTPDPEARGIRLAVERAIRSANIRPEDINYICTHGTGTPANDKAETIVMKTIFKDNYKKVPISSVKSMLGHSMGAASGIEAVTCCLALRDNVITPTINYETFDEECDIDCVPNVARECNLDIVANNAYAFGGNNTCVLFKKYRQ